MGKKSFLITVDTEGDNLWAWKPGVKITTENESFLNRFQCLCNKYGYKPTYFTNYEMAVSDNFNRFIKPYLKSQQCEIGMHLHAWNSPPEYFLKNANNGGQPFLIEYPYEIMEQKIKYVTDLLENRLEEKIVSHRAGRWVLNKEYTELLIKYGYLTDCSVTPHINWKAAKGSNKIVKGNNYKKYSEEPYWVFNKDQTGKILEIPMTIREKFVYAIDKKTIKGALKAGRDLVLGKKIWLRPNGKNLIEMKGLVDEIYLTDTEYIMFMIHSSEIMPGGSPYFRDRESIEKLYQDMEDLFQYIRDRYLGETVKGFFNRWVEKYENRNIDFS